MMPTPNAELLSIATRHLVIGGVSGAGKSTVAAALAARLGWQYWDADDFHSVEARQRMAAGLPLNDSDRLPWLSRLHQALVGASFPTVLACSALKRRYRDVLRGRRETGLVRVVMLTLSPEEAARRVAQRGKAHFMPASLVASQFEALELGEDCVQVDACAPLESVVEAIISLCSLPGGEAMTDRGIDRP